MIGRNQNPHLDRRVALQRKLVTRDENGGEVITWKTVAEVWARKLVVNSGRQFAADGKQYTHGVEYDIRHRDDVHPGMQLVHGDDVFEIVGVIPGEDRERYLTLAVLGQDQTVAHTVRPIL